MSLLSFDEALAHVLALARLSETETVPLREAAGRVLSEPVVASRDQPPFAASAMDGYAVCDGDAVPGARLQVIGEAAAGHGFAGTVGPGQAVRIFTGAPLPKGAERVVIQEDVEPQGDMITLKDTLDSARHVRPSGGDFQTGDSFQPKRALTPADLMVIAAMNHGTVEVRRKPEVAILATGDELVPPGGAPAPDQIIASNNLALAAMLEAAGAQTRLLPIAKDTPESLTSAFELATGADILVTIGGASVGDHDLVGKVAADLGMERSFYKVAMRPGKPLMAGRLGQMALVGLPGNPVSALVCGRIFLVPLLRACLGLPETTDAPEPRRLSHPLPPNGPRAHYMRARSGPEGTIEVAENQDSSLSTVLAWADCLAIRPPHDPARAAGEAIDCLHL